MDQAFKYKKVMVVDDTNVDRLIAEKIIIKSKFAEHVIPVDGAQSALAYLKINPEELPDLIFLDINMPLMNGFDFLDEYNKLADTIRKKSIVMLSSSLNEIDMKRADENPYVIKFITKPLTTDSLKQL